jgi:hypothetical protein
MYICCKFVGFLLIVPVYFSKLNGIIDTKKNEVMIENGSKQNQKKESNSHVAKDQLDEV